MTALQIIGGGKMGSALLGGLLSAQWAPPPELRVVEALDDQRRQLQASWPEVVVSDQPETGVDTLLAVKPHHVVDLCAELGEPPRVMSVAAGITIEAMETALPPATRVIRVMPNTPALVGQGAAAVAGGTRTTEEDLAWAVGILEAVGRAVVVPETQLDAVTGLSGSGPAYVFLIAEALTAAGVSARLPADVADTLARQTLLGAATLLSESGASPAELRAQVTTPAGTTAAGLRVLEQQALRGAVIDAVHAATERSRELGRSGG